MKKKWLAAVLAGALLAAALLSGCSSVETVKRLRFGVAGEGGIYREFGERFAALENETDNGQVELKATAGSAAKLRRPPQAGGPAARTCALQEFCPIAAKAGFWHTEHPAKDMAL